jgi:serine/threonine-protein kinase HipA
VLDEDGALAIGKFPSVQDERPVTRLEVLAMTLAARAGMRVADARVLDLEARGSKKTKIPITLVRRFDRDASGSGARIPYLSAASMLQASRQEDRSYEEIALVIRQLAPNPMADLAELWRRMLFNLLITNVDDHLQNHAFLHSEHGKWRLSPAFDLNPFPDKERESKTWLSQEDGPIVALEQLLDRAADYGLKQPRAARAIVTQVYRAVAAWRPLALSPGIGLTRRDVTEVAPAFEHQALRDAAKVSGTARG